MNWLRSTLRTEIAPWAVLAPFLINGLRIVGEGAWRAWVGVCGTLGTVIPSWTFKVSQVVHASLWAIMTLCALLTVRQEHPLVVWLPSSFGALVLVVWVDYHVSNRWAVATNWTLSNSAPAPLANIAGLTSSAIGLLPGAGHDGVGLVRTVEWEALASGAVLARLTLLTCWIGGAGNSLRAVVAGETVVND